MPVMPSLTLQSLVVDPTLVVAVGFDVQQLKALFALTDVHVVDATRIASPPFWNSMPDIILVDVMSVIQSGSADAQAALRHISCYPRTRGLRVILSCASVRDAGIGRTNADAMIVAPQLTRAFISPPALLCHDHTSNHITLIELPEDDPVRV